MKANIKAKLTHSKAESILDAMGIECKKGGEIGVAFLATVRGTLKRGEDYESAQTCSALGLVDMARTLRACGITGKAIKKNIILASLGKLKLNEEHEKQAAEIVKDIQATFARLPKAKREGKRTGELTFEIISN